MRTMFCVYMERSVKWYSHHYPKLCMFCNLLLNYSLVKWNFYRGCSLPFIALGGEKKNETSSNLTTALLFWLTWQNDYTLSPASWLIFCFERFAMPFLGSGLFFLILKRRKFHLSKLLVTCCLLWLSGKIDYVSIKLRHVPSQLCYSHAEGYFSKWYSQDGHLESAILYFIH